MFFDRKQAGELLCLRLLKLNISDALILAIPRGGVVVGWEIAEKFKFPLKILIIKKVGSLYNPELAIGAVAPDNINFVDEEIATNLNIISKEKAALFREKRKELTDRIRLYKIRYPKTYNRKTIILTDDGIATGATIKAAIKFLIHKEAKKIILAVPVISKDSYDELKLLVDKLVAIEIPDSFGAVGQFYKYFPQISDSEVMQIIKKARRMN